MTALFKNGQIRILAVVWLICAVGGLMLPRTLTIFDSIEKWLEDVRVATLSPRMPRRQDIVLLTITEGTLAQFPYRSPVDRNLLADVLRYLDQAGVRAVGLDILLDQPTEPDKDRNLAEAAASLSAPLVIGWADQADGMTERQVAYLTDYLPGAIKAYPNLVKGDRDGTVRWIFPGRRGEQGFRPGFAAAVTGAVGVPATSDEVRLLYRRGVDGGLVPFPTFPLHQLEFPPLGPFLPELNTTNPGRFWDSLPNPYVAHAPMLGRPNC